MAADGEIPFENPEPDAQPTLEWVAQEIARARVGEAVEMIRHSYTGPDGGFTSAESDWISLQCDNRLAELKKPARGQKDLIDKGQPTPE
jgi:hypothetical protein